MIFNRGLLGVGAEAGIPDPIYNWDFNLSDPLVDKVQGQTLTQVGTLSYPSDVGEGRNVMDLSGGGSAKLGVVLPALMDFTTDDEPRTFLLRYKVDQLGTFFSFSLLNTPPTSGSHLYRAYTQKSGANVRNLIYAFNQSSVDVDSYAAPAWHTLALVLDGTFLITYIDGVMMDEASAENYDSLCVTYSYDGTCEFALGLLNSVSADDKQFAFLKVYDSVLTTDQQIAVV